MLFRSAAAAQDAREDAPRFTFDLDTRLVADDNLGLAATSPGTVTYWENSLGLAFESETRRSRLGIGLGAVTRLGHVPGGDDLDGLGDADLEIAYAREVADSRLSVDGRYALRDLSVFDPFDDAIELEDGTIVTDNAGTRATAFTGLTLETGLTRPLGLQFELSQRRTAYTDTIDPDLSDDRETRAALGIRMRLTPTTEGLLEATRSHFTAEDALRRDRERRELSYGITHELPRRARLEARLGITDIEEEFRVGGVPPLEERGVTGSLSLSRALPAGSIGFSAETRLETTGRRNSLSVERVIERETARLSLGLGVTSGEDGEVEPTADIVYEEALATGTFEASLSQGIRTTDEDEDLSRLRLGLAYGHDIDALSRISLGVDYVSETELGAGSASDEERGTLSITYSRALTRDWALDLGYRYDFEETGTTARADGNRVFLGLSRSLTAFR